MSIPKLRFKEFHGNWIESRLSELALKITDGTHDTPIVQKEGMPFLTAINIKDGFINYHDINYVDETTHKKIFERCNPEKDDLLIVNIGAGTATCARNIVDYPFSLKNVALVKPNKKLLNPVFLEQFQRKNSAKLFVSLTSGGAQPFLSLKEIGKLVVKYSSLEEQTKIASFLSAVDEKIVQLTQKHELLSQYKQGMMQKLFSQQIRFKADDGSEFEEWEEKRLIDSIDTNIKWSFTGGPFGSNLKSEDYTATGIRIIQLQNIGDGVFLDSYKIYTSFEKANELLSCNIYPSEILISKMGDPVARCCIVPDYHDRYVMCSDGIRLVVDKLKFSSVFMFYQINYQDFRQSASDVSTGSTRKRIGLNDLKQLPIKVPCLEEQTKIANFLSAIDQKIEVVAQQIEQAKEWKKGLLQQMFV